MIFTASHTESASNESILTQFIAYLAGNHSTLGMELPDMGETLIRLYQEGFTFSFEPKTFSEIYEDIKDEFEAII